MRLVSYKRSGEQLCGILYGGQVQDLGICLEDWLKGVPGNPGGLIYELTELQLTAPLLKPGKIVCIGLNYRDHCTEQGAKVPKNPVIFAKYSNAVIGPGQPIIRPGFVQQLDYEAELAVVIGKTGRKINPEEALQFVAGYCCFNDVSARDLQFSDRQWVRGKTLDSFAPMGPFLVTADEVPDPQNLKISSAVNGEIRQNSNTNQMIFGIPYLISFISQGITLEPGDVIATGTPAGVGAFRNPPSFLQPGDVVRIEIENIGVLENQVQEEPA